MLAEALRLIRIFHDLKQHELAVRLGISKSYLSEIETGRKSPSVEIIEKYAKIFQIPASSILFFSEQLGENGGSHNRTDKARGMIAGKILDFLRIVEARTERDVKETG